MVSYTDSERLSLRRVLSQTIEQYQPRTVLVLTTEHTGHWSHSILNPLHQNRAIQSLTYESRQILAEKEFPTENQVLTFNADMYSPLRSLSTDEIKRQLHHEKDAYFLREKVENFKQLDDAEFVIIDDEFFASRGLAELFLNTPFLFMTGIKTFQSFSPYCTLLKQKDVHLCYEDHSTPKGFALFQQPLSATKEVCTTPSLEEPEEVCSEKSFRFDYSTPESYMIVMPPEPDKAFHALSLLRELAQTEARRELFVVCENGCREFFSRVAGVDQLFSYDASTRHEEPQKIKGFVSDLHLLKPDKLLLLTEEEDPLSALLSYQFSHEPTTIHCWGEILGQDTPFSKDSISRFATTANAPEPTHSDLFALKSWEEEWAKQFFENNHLTKENTLFLFSRGKYPAETFGSALAPFLERNGYSLLVGDSAPQELLEKLPLENIVSIEHQLPLGQIAALMSRSRLVIGGESIPFYLSTLLHLPHVLIAGGGALSQNFPRTDRTTVACLPFGCFDCDWRCRLGKETNNNKCLQELSPEVIQRAISSALEASQQRMQVLFESDSSEQTSSPEEIHMSLFGDGTIDLVPLSK